MRIIFNERNRTVERATEMSNEILQNNSFFQEISNHPSFDFSTASPATIADLMRNSNFEFHVEFFYPNLLNRLSKFKKTLAYTDKRYPDTLFLNVRKLRRSPESIAATIIHEIVHALDRQATEYTFGHGNNSSVGKGNSAPYWIGNLAYRMLMNNPHLTALLFDQSDIGDDDALADL